MNSTKKTSISIVAIILAFWIFFPLGFILVYLRLKEKHGKYYAITKELFWTGIILCGFGVLYICTSVGERDFISDYLPAGIFIFVIPGAICYYFGNKRNKKMKMYDKYMLYISTRKNIKIDGLCNNIGTDYDSALKVVEEMISKGLIDGYIDDDELIMRKKDGNNQYYDEPTKDKECKVVKCKECGAKNTIVVGEVKECEYCGTLLQ